MTHILLVATACYLGIGALLFVCFLLMHFSLGGKFRDLVDAGVQEIAHIPEPANPAWSRRTSVAMGLAAGVMLKWPIIVFNTIKQLWVKYSQSR